MFHLLRRATKINFQAPNVQGLLDENGDAIVDMAGINTRLAEHYEELMGRDDWS